MSLRLLLFAALAVSLYGQAKPVVRVWTYAGTPTAGDCTAANVGHVAIDTSTEPDTVYDCSGASPAWVLRGAAVTPGTGITISGSTVAVDTAVVPTKTLASTFAELQTFAKGINISSSTALASAGDIRYNGGTIQFRDGGGSQTLMNNPFTTRGDLVIQGASGPTRLAAGASGLFLMANGAASDPSYQTPNAAQITNAFDKSTNNAIGAFYMDISEMTAPSAPGANVARLYSKDDAGTTKVCYKDSAGAETCVGSGSGSGAPNYSESFSSVTSVTMTGAEHGMGSANLLIACYDTATPRNNIEPGNITIDPTSYDVVVSFSSSSSGNCVVNGAGGAGSTVANYSTSFTSQTTVTVTNATHGMNSAALLVMCYDNSSPRKIIEPGEVTVNSSTFEVVITFSTSTTGNCVISGAGGGGGGAAWGDITGTLSAQTDLQSALDAKEAALTFSGPLSRSTNTISCPTCVVDSGTYSDPSWITGLAASKITGVVSAANGGAGTVNGILKANGSGTVSAASAGTDYVVPAGNVATATALAANGGNCSAGSYPLGVDASGAAESCTATASATETLTNKTLDPAATGNAITFIDRTYLTAAGCNAAAASTAWDLPTASAPTPACLGTTTTSAYLGYADGSTTAATVHYRLPSTWTATGGVDMMLLYTGSTNSTNNIRWSASTACVADTEDLIAPSYNAASASNSAGPTTAGQRRSLSLTGVAITNCAAGETMFIRVERIGADGGDTYTGEAQLMGLTLVTRRVE